MVDVEAGQEPNGIAVLKVHHADHTPKAETVVNHDCKIGSDEADSDAICGTKHNQTHDMNPLQKLFILLTLSLSYQRGRSLGRTCLWAGAGSDRSSAQCEPAPPR